MRATSIIYKRELGRYLRSPIGWIIAFATERINILQFLTIRRYLTLVFMALLLLLLVLAI